MKTRCCYPKRYLLLFFSLLVSVGSILMSVSLSSCSSSVKSPLLLSADSLMEIYPDSALSILESISSPQKLPCADRALYALLLTQARHKNYIALGDDSLIKTAVEYYGDKKGSSSNLVVISFLFQLSSSFLILLKVVDMFAF